MAILRGLRFTVIAAVVVVGALALFLPGNRTSQDGSPDPLIDVRRPVVKFLRQVGVVPESTFTAPDPWLPSILVSSTGDGGPYVSIERRPVYRGLLWRIGVRLRCTVRDDRFRQLRLTVSGPSESATAEGTPVDSPSAEMYVECFEPSGSAGWRLDGIDRAGEVHLIWSESPVEKHITVPKLKGG